MPQRLRGFTSIGAIEITLSFPLPLPLCRPLNGRKSLSRVQRQVFDVLHEAAENIIEIEPHALNRLQ